MSRFWRLAPWVIAGVLALVIAGGVALGSFQLFSNRTEERNTQILDSITRSEQVVLLSLGIQGISKRDDQSFFFDWGVPGSERATYLQYGFTAKLGIDGSQVQVEQVSPDAFLVTIPEFVFLGHDDISFEVAAENNGLLSWVTPEISTVDMVNAILNDESRAEYLRDNAATLREQAEHFYRRIISSIDPGVTIEFVFADSLAPAPAG